MFKALLITKNEDVGYRCALTELDEASCPRPAT